MKAVKHIIDAFRDLIIRFLPTPKNKDYAYAFLVHPRNTGEVAKKYSIMKFLPAWSVEFFTRNFWPVVISKITGLKSAISGKDVPGFLISIPLTAKQMMENRKLALTRIRQAVKLAEKHGAKIIGLGALTSSLSRGGLDLVDSAKIKVTTGHAYTAFNVTSNLFKLADIFSIGKNCQVAIVGATGSVRSTSAKVIARAGYQNLLLIDVERKKHLFADLVAELKELQPGVNIIISNQIRDIREADFIITATNSPEALITSEDLKPGTVVIDDAQPSDVDASVLDREDVLAIEAGVVHTPGVKCNFNLGLKGREDNFCCMAEVLVLASEEWDNHYVINRADLKLVDEISELGKKLNFRVGDFQNFKELISPDKIEYVKSVIRSRQTNAV